MTSSVSAGSAASLSTGLGPAALASTSGASASGGGGAPPAGGAGGGASTSSSSSSSDTTSVTSYPDGSTVTTVRDAKGDIVSIVVSPPTETQPAQSTTTSSSGTVSAYA